MTTSIYDSYKLYIEAVNKIVNFYPSGYDLPHVYLSNEDPTYKIDHQ